MQIAYLDGARLRRALIVGSERLMERAAQLNAINVFPVPDGDTGTNMASTARTIVNELRGSGPLPLGLALNEALANVFKHGCGPGQCGADRAGRVNIRGWQEPDGLLRIEICDDGPGLPVGLVPEQAGSLGMKLMHGLVRRQLGGELDIDSQSAEQGGGVCVRIRFRPNIAK